MTIDTLRTRGEITRTARIFSNDPAFPEKEIEIKARVIPVLTIRPSRIYLNGIEGETLRSTTIIQGNKSGKLTLDIKENTLLHKIKCKLSPLKDQNSFRLTVENTRRSPGVFRSRIILSSNYKERPLFRVPVMGRIQKTFEVLPQSIDFGQINKDMVIAARDKAWRDKHFLARLPKLEHQIIVRANDTKVLNGQHLKVNSVKWDKTLLDVVVEPAKTGYSYRIRLSVRVMEIEKKGEIETSVKIYTNHPRHPCIEVPVRLEIIGKNA